MAALVPRENRCHVLRARICLHPLALVLNCGEVCRPSARSAVVFGRGGFDAQQTCVSPSLIAHPVYRRSIAISANQRRRAGPSETGSRSSCLASALVNRIIVLAEAKCPRQDSNLRTRLRRPLLYPLSYGGVRLAAARRRVEHYQLPEAVRDGICGGRDGPVGAGPEGRRREGDHGPGRCRGRCTRAPPERRPDPRKGRKSGKPGRGRVRGPTLELCPARPAECWLSTTTG